MKFPSNILVFGDQSFRGDCPLEAAEQKTFVNQIRLRYPNTYGRLIVHNKNEGKRTPQQAARDKAAGMTKGAIDIIIPGGRSFLCEFKRKDHTKSSWQDGQIEYLEAGQKTGAFACVALGHEAAMEAFLCYLNTL